MIVGHYRKYDSPGISSRQRELLVTQSHQRIDRRAERQPQASPPRRSCGSELWRPGPYSQSASQGVARDAGGDGWHNAVPSQFLHEQIQETGLHPIQRRDSSERFPSQYRPARISWFSRVPSSIAATFLVSRDPII